MQTKTENQLLMPKRKVYEDKLKPGKLPQSQPPNQQRIKHEAGLVFIPTTADVHQQMRHLTSMKRSPAIPFSNSSTICDGLPFLL